MSPGTCHWVKKQWNVDLPSSLPHSSHSKFQTFINNSLGYKDDKDTKLNVILLPENIAHY